MNECKVHSHLRLTQSRPEDVPNKLLFTSFFHATTAVQDTITSSWILASVLIIHEGSLQQKGYN